ncbi:MAG: hypothetical protein V1843_04055 [bacterium]
MKSNVRLPLKTVAPSLGDDDTYSQKLMGLSPSQLKIEMDRVEKAFKRDPNHTLYAHCMVPAAMISFQKGVHLDAVNYGLRVMKLEMPSNFRELTLQNALEASTDNFNDLTPDLQSKIKLSFQNFINSKFQVLRPSLTALEKMLWISVVRSVFYIPEYHNLKLQLAQDLIQDQDLAASHHGLMYYIYQTTMNNTDRKKDEIEKEIQIIDHALGSHDYRGAFQKLDIDDFEYAIVSLAYSGLWDHYDQLLSDHNDRIRPDFEKAIALIQKCRQDPAWAYNYYLNPKREPEAYALTENNNYGDIIDMILLNHLKSFLNSNNMAQTEFKLPTHDEADLLAEFLAQPRSSFVQESDSIDIYLKKLLTEFKNLIPEDMGHIQYPFNSQLLDLLKNIGARNMMALCDPKHDILEIYLHLENNEKLLKLSYQISGQYRRIVDRSQLADYANEPMIIDILILQALSKHIPLIKSDKSTRHSESFNDFWNNTIKKGAGKYLIRCFIKNMRVVEKLLKEDNYYQVDGHIALMNRLNVIDKIMNILANDISQWSLDINHDLNETDLLHDMISSIRIFNREALDKYLTQNMLKTASSPENTTAFPIGLELTSKDGQIFFILLNKDMSISLPNISEKLDPLLLKYLKGLVLNTILIYTYPPLQKTLGYVIGDVPIGKKDEAVNKLTDIYEKMIFDKMRETGAGSLRWYYRKPGDVLIPLEADTIEEKKRQIDSLGAPNIYIPTGIGSIRRLPVGPQKHPNGIIFTPYQSSETSIYHQQLFEDSQDLITLQGLYLISTLSLGGSVARSDLDSLKDKKELAWNALINHGYMTLDEATNNRLGIIVKPLPTMMADLEIGSDFTDEEKQILLTAIANYQHYYHLYPHKIRLMKEDLQTDLEELSARLINGDFASYEALMKISRSRHKNRLEWLQNKDAQIIDQTAKIFEINTTYVRPRSISLAELLAQGIPL